MCGLFRSRTIAAIAYSAILIWFMVRPDTITVFGLSDNNDAGRLPSFLHWASFSLSSRTWYESMQN